LTGRRDAAFVGSLAFAFAPYHASQLSHLQTEATFFMPVTLVGLHRYWTTGARRWLVLLAASAALNGFICGYFLLYFSVLLALAVAWLAVSSRDWRKLASVTAAFGAALLLHGAIRKNLRRCWCCRRRFLRIAPCSSSGIFIAPYPRSSRSAPTSARSRLVPLISCCGLARRLSIVRTLRAIPASPSAYW
jgi:hypothetical protein